MSTEIHCRVFGPRMLSPQQTEELFMKKAEAMLWDQSKAGLAEWKALARKHRRSGRYSESLDVIDVYTTDYSSTISIGSTLIYAEYLEDGHKMQTASGRALGNLNAANTPWGGYHLRGGWPAGKGGAGNWKKYPGLVFKRTSGPARPAKFVEKVMLVTQTDMRAAVAAAGRDIRDEIVAAMDAESE